MARERGVSAAGGARGGAQGSGGARGAQGSGGAADPQTYARDLCLRRLAIRPQTRAELAAVLRRHGIDETVTAEVLGRYDEVGLIDDEAFARAWVTSRHHGKGLARRALAGELRRKGIADETVSEALAELDGQTEEATARALVARKLRAGRNDKPEAIFRRLVGMLARKGYPPGLAVRVVKDVLAEQPEQSEFAVDIDIDAMVDAIGDAEERRESG